MDFILEIKDNISDDKCKEIIERFEKDDRKVKGRTLGGDALEHYKKSTDLCLSVHDDWKDIDKYLYERLNEGLDIYKKHLGNIIGDYTHIFGDIKDSGYQIQRTTKGEYYTWHDDHNTKQGRILTYIWYLNTLDLHIDGGSTAFHCGKRIRPEQGKLIIFPATWTYVHCGTPVVSDKTKYICTGWILAPTT